MTTAKVLICGAGPTGLAAALILAKRGIAVRIIDQNEQRSDKSKALAVQAGTLDCLGAAIGDSFVGKLIEAGHPTREAFIQINEDEPVCVNLGKIPGAHNFILFLEQSETERLLEEELATYNVRVERNATLLEFQEINFQIFSKVKTPSGQSEEIVSDFLIGSDGAHSITRKILGIPFHGSAYTGDFILGDVKLKWDWPIGSVRTFVSERGVVISFPLKDGRYRLILVPKVIKPTDELEISPEEFQSVLSKLSLGKIFVTDSFWLTRFRVNHRIVHQFQKGRVFLAGDAAHIHSPAGGQGMNTGIQDSLNLGVKLDAVISGRKPLESLLDYEKERLPVAKKVLRLTDLVFKLALMPEGMRTRLLRKFVIPRAIRSHWIQKQVMTAMSEVNIARREIARYS